MSPIELVGVVLALAYLLLAMKEHPLCWIAAFASSVCYIQVFFSAGLYTESALQFFFIALAIQGLRRWKSGAEDSSGAQISLMTRTQHLRGIGLSVLGSLVLGLGVYLATETPVAFIDSAITVFSVYTTYLVTEKYLENWLYWIVIDCVATGLYIVKGLYPTAGLFALYVILATLGYFQWKRAMT